MRFKAGDIIRVKTFEGEEIRIGKALQDRDFIGLAYFSILDKDGRIYEYNLNEVATDVLYSDPYPEHLIASMMRGV